MSPEPRYEEPFHWWGPRWTPVANLTIGDLLRDGMIDAWTAAVLWAALARRRSLVVIAGPSGAGKSTLLNALLEFLPADTRRIYPRGCFETFAFLRDPAVVPGATALLINEISPHLPVYLWGPGVARTLATTEHGFMVLATAHAASVAEFVGALTGSPLRLPAPLVGTLEFLVLLNQSDGWQEYGRVSAVTRLQPTRDGVAVEQVTPDPVHDISQELAPEIKPHQPWFPAEEILVRQTILNDLRERRIENVPEFH